MAGKRPFYWIFMAIVAFAIIYFYFLPFETHILYGDDLIYYKYNAHLHTFANWLTGAMHDHKFRPVTGIINGILFQNFDKSLHGYYIFNVLIQTGIALIFTRLAGLLIHSMPLSFMAGLLAATSRFAFYNITQLSCGGSMEGVALILFLCTAYCLLQTFIQPAGSRRNFILLITAMLFANLAVYTHERYIVLFAFIMIVAWAFPYRNKLQFHYRIIITVLAMMSITINVLFKKVVFGIPFFLGTGGQQIHPDPKSALLYLSEGLLSILQINAGDQSMIGVSAIHIEHAFQFIIALLGIYMLVLLRQFLLATNKERKLAGNKLAGIYNPDPMAGDLQSPGAVMLFLTMLFFLCLVPAIATVRLEQRWLQASLCIFLLMLIVAFTCINIYTPAIRNGSFALFLALFLLSDHNYLHKGAKQMFMTRSANVARALMNAAGSGVIRQDAKHLYFEEDWWLYTEWVTEQGYLFTCYGRPLPAITFISDLKLDHDSYTPPLPDFHPGDQVLRVKEDTIYDVTNRYLSGHQ